MTDPQGRVKRYTTETATRRMVAIKRATSSIDTLTLTYGSDGRVASASNGSASWTYAWTLSGSTLTGTVTQPLSRQRIVTADTAKGNLLTDTDGLNRTTTYGYDSYGRPSSITAPEGNYTSFTYDGRGNRTLQTAVAKSGSGLTSLTTSASFDTTCANQKTCNQPNSTTDARGNVTNFTYDPTHGGLLTMTAPAPASGGTRPQTRLSYTALYAYYKNSSGAIVAAPTPIYKLTSVSTCRTNASCAGTADETRTTYSYGSAGVANPLLPTSVSVGSGDGTLTATTTTAYDYVGNATSIDGPLPGAADTTTVAYNADRQVVQITSPDPDGAGPLNRRAVQFTYDLDGQVTGLAQGTANAAGGGFAVLQQSTTTYDVLGRKVQASIAASGTTYALTQYSYDAANRLDCVASRMNPAVFGALPAACTLGTAAAFGSDRIARYTYDNADHPLKVTTGYGLPGLKRDEVTNSYTPNGKVATAADGKSNVTSYAYDGFDRLVTTFYPSPTTVGASSTTDYEQLGYDAGSNVTSRRLRDANNIGYAYDTLGRMTQRTLPGLGTDDTTTTYNYDLLGHVLLAAKNATNQTSFTWDALGRKLSEANYYYALAMQYDAAGRRTRLTWNDGFYVTYDYLVTGEMLSVRENGVGSGVGVLATYGYDDLGRRTTLTRGNGTVTGYAYDPASRLTQLTQDLAGTSADLTIGLAYNPAGQIVTRTASNDAYAWTQAYNVSRAYTTNGLNQYTASGSIVPTYDARGNTTSAGSQTYQYTSQNRLWNAPGATTLYADSLERLDYVSVENTLFAHDGNDMVAESTYTGGVGPLLRRYVFGAATDEPLVWYEGAGTTDRRWLHADERGSVIATSDASGTMTAINAYDEFGIPQSTNVGRFQYTGQKWIPSLGMYDYKARIYSPTLGRFMQTDPIGYGDGMNWYNYVHSDPVNESDPSGMFINSAGEIVSCGETGGCGGGGNFSGLMFFIQQYGLQNGFVGLQDPGGGGDASSAGAVGAANTPDANSPQNNQKMVNCNSGARQIVNFANDFSSGVLGSALIFGALGAEPAAAALAGAAGVADGISLIAGGYVYLTEGDSTPLKSSFTGTALGAVGGFSIKAFGGSSRIGLGGVRVTHAPNGTQVEAGKYAGGQAGGAVPAQICH